ncbi:MAG: hypothetical protein NTZ18_01320 [Candidatus Komeilibacteria bacterium]|nr:hypothetical protein [Candidatus Komeilibacteria bacterium]
MVKNNQGKIFQIGILSGIILFILNSLEGWLSSGLYAASDPALWKTMAGNWWVYNLVFNLIVGLLLALVFAIFYRGLPDQGVGRGLQFGFWIWLVGMVPGLLMTILTMAVPEELVVLWLVTGLFNYLAVGIMIGLMYQPKEN